MARAINKLTPRTISALTERGMYSDGGGLWLQVSAFGSKAWIFRYDLNGKRRSMGLGPIHTISLAEARQAALEARKLLREGKGPIEDRNTRLQAAKLATAKTLTFSQCMDAYLEAHEDSWRNPKHRQQWRNTLETYAVPAFGVLSVAAIDTGLVMKALEPIWKTKTETASRLRGRIESVLDWATVRGYRSRENPARWKGHLDALLASPNKIKGVEHHAALDYRRIGVFMAELRTQEGIAANALEFAILTATRTGETIGATWGEIDLNGRIWAIPAGRMKGKREHRVPLSDAAAAVLEKMKDHPDSEYVFPGARIGRPLSNMALLMTLRRMGRGDLTAHGFRSTFRDWAAEATGYPREVAEMALAHAVGDKVEAAYRRGDLFDKRRRLMDDWARYCAQRLTSAEATPIRGTAA